MEKDDLEKRLQESEENLRFLIESIHDTLYNVDTRGIFTYISPAITFILRYEASKIIGIQFGEFFFKEDLPVIMKKFIEHFHSYLVLSLIYSADKHFLQ